MVSLDDLFNKPRQAVKSYGEVLPWFGMVTDNIVLCHDGSLIAGFEFDGRDIEGVDDSMLNHSIEQLQNAMRQLNERITVWFVQERRYEPEYHYAKFPNKVAAEIDRQWGRSMESYANARIRHSLYIGYSYPNKSEAFFEEMQAELEQSSNGFAALIKVAKKRLNEKTAIGSIRGRLAEMTEDFVQIIHNFSDIVVGPLGFRRLENEYLLGDLYARANLASPRGPVNLPTGMPYLNTIIPADDLVRQGDMLEFRGPSKRVFAAALSTTTLPNPTSSIQMDNLMSSPCEFIMVQTFKFIERDVVEKLIFKAEEHYRNEVKSVFTRLFEQLTKIQSDKVNTGNILLAEDAQAALVELTANETAFGYYNLTLLPLGPNQKEVQRSADILSTRMRTAGYTVTRESQGLIPAFLGSLPGNSKTQLRKYLVSLANVADLAPIRTLTQGEATHPHFSRKLKRDVPALCKFMTPYGVPFSFNTHAEDLGHTVIIGGSGAGKTTLVQLLTAQFQKYYPCNTFIFDKDRSMALMSTMMGGAHMDLSDEKSGIRINPIKRMLKNNDQLALTKWLTILMTSNGLVPTPEEQEKVSEQVQKLAGLGERQWRLGTLFNLLRGTDKALARKLMPFVDRSEDQDDEYGYGRGIFSGYFDNDDDDFDLDALVCLETGKLLQMPEVAAPLMDYAFYCIDKALDGTRPTFIYVEEAWYMLANPTFEEQINNWLRTFRKKNAFVVFATQSADELQKLKSWTAFIVNVPTLILLPSVKESVSQIAPLYKKLFNLNDAQLSLLSVAVPKRDYLLIKPDVTRLVSTAMPELLLAINEGTATRGVLEKAKQYKEMSSNWEQDFAREVLDVAF